jgi:ferritin-like metal-binding protein YciE
MEIAVGPPHTYSRVNRINEVNMELESLRELYIDELKDLYSAEKQLVKALPKMAKNATSPELKQAFEDHLAKTEQHVERLEQIFESLEASPRGKKCVGMEGLIEEAKELLEEDAAEEVLDAGLISKAQHVEHYEMAGYGTVRTYALTLGESEHAELLEQTLNEEKEADELLTQLAESSINIEAATADEEEEQTSRGRKEDREVSRSVSKEGSSSRGRGSSTPRSRSQSSRASAR